jgi:glycosyltransferase involved in cell wall biosynthesis
MKISYIAATCVKNDAISNALRCEIAWLRESGHDVRLFAYACDYKDVPFTPVTTSAGIGQDRYFYDSDLVVFHFGIYFELFNAIFLCPDTMAKLVVFHNITPKKFLPPRMHKTIDASFVQLSNAGFADHVLCDSQYNLDVLRRHGVRTPATVLPLAVPRIEPPRSAKPSRADGRLRLVFIGRFVVSKGPMDLLEAVLAVAEQNPDLCLDLDLVGNANFSDPTLMGELEAFAETRLASLGGRIAVRFHYDAPDARKYELLAAADLFVLPTYHEGFCVPIVEAFMHGCRVIAYDNSNVPFIGGGLVRLVPTGDTTALATAIQEAAQAMAEPSWTETGYAAYRDQALAVARQYDPRRIKDKFLEFVASC